MNRNFFYFLILLLLCQFSFGQPPKGEKPDYAAIKKAIEDKKSDSYYPKLMERLTARDTTLQQADFKNIYFGYTFQKEYSPYGINSTDDKLKAYFQKDSLVPSDYKPFIDLANKELKSHPFDLRVMNMLSYVYHLNKEEELSFKNSYILNGLVDAIITSGDGLTCETGFHVISVSHEYSILGMFQLESLGQSLVDHCDYLRFEKGKYKIDGLYFDVGKLFDAMMEKK